MNKQQLIEALRLSLTGDDQSKDAILEAVSSLIPDDSALLNDRRVYNGFSIYRRFHPDLPDSEVNIGDVISWLQHAGSMEYINRLEARLAKINEMLMTLGPIDPDECASVPNMLILEMRVLSLLDPHEKPSRLRKIKTSKKH